MRMRTLVYAIGDDALMYDCDYYPSFFTREFLQEIQKSVNDTLAYYDKMGLNDESINEINDYLWRKHLEDNAEQIKTKKTQNLGDLYVVRDKGMRAIKVGRSINVKSRINQLQTSSARELELVKIYKFCGFLEKQIHTELMEDGLHIKREWFCDNETSWNIINQIIKKYYGQDKDK